MTRRPKLRLYAKLNSFVWRERWQNVVHLAPLWLAILGILATLAAPLLTHRPDDWAEGKRLPGTAVEGGDHEPN